MSSTENTGDRTQQATATPEERPEGAVVEATPVDEGALTATPDGAVPEVAQPAESSPVVDGPGPAVPPPAEPPAPEPPTAEPPAVEPAAAESPAVTPPAAESPAPAAGDTASAAVTPEAGTPAAADPADAAVADPTSDSSTAATAPRPAPAGPPSGHAPADVPSVVPAMPVSDPSAWGRVDEEGTVYVRTATGERSVGSWQAGAPAEGLAHYGRRFDDLATEVTLLEARLAAHTGNPGEIRTKAQELADSIPLAQAVGDLDSLSARARAMVSMADTAVAANRAEKAAQRAVQVQRKEALAAEAEQIAADSTQWKAAGDRLKAIVEEWKTIKGIDRKTDEALWQRFAAARDAFGRRRGAHFAELDKQRGESRAAKSELIAEAERLSTSTEWGPTSAAMRGLMDRWKAVPRVGRDTDDDLWKKFRAAQDVFFAARTANDQARSSDELANQKAKEELLAEAEKLDPANKGNQNALRKIQERYDAIGHVPRGAMRELEDRMRTVEEKFRGASESARPRVQPENPLLTSMRAAVTKAEDQLAKAQAAGNAKRISEAEAALATRREWLAEAEKASSRR
ncbi:DUF349 domain-containing protein [Modestobacter sp. VKM Ac-2985]|uniref:DUF349 domain-containing protein n=1 Tax=Modestobacter sp. VKM Ac-2985 TaxID=3004139 RepID=UPI0022AB6564|nr:DUF349 domain-containing protein [Modestobacter sp. VKM Ac-2985]MCZ2840048.1 DUF349 domain-containing protein [Modestobacter sp. VKM Ac-2985]